MNKCRYCGAPLNNLSKLESRCEYCDQLNLTSSDGSNHVYTLDDLANRMLDAASVNALDDIKKYASMINEKSEGSFSSHYFEKYANFRLKIKNEVSEFLNQYTGEITDQDDRAIKHLIQHGELRDKKPILKFLKHHAPGYVKVYLEHYQSRTKAEDNYAKVPRDVFICYNQSNLVIANQIVKLLENESISCWISHRNLREEGFSNYWDDIEDALDKTSLVVLVSSESEMNSPDVLRELEYANEHNIKVVEFKIDSAPHNLAFQHMFYGVQWIDGTKDLEKAYLNLKKRVFHDLKLIKKDQKESKSTSKSIKKAKKTSQSSLVWVVRAYYIFISVVLISMAIGLRFILPFFELEIPFSLPIIEALLS